jgi:hypothetical protein
MAAFSPGARATGEDWAGGLERDGELLRSGSLGFSWSDGYAIRESCMRLMEMKPQDVLVALKLASSGAWEGTYAASRQNSG